MLKAFLSVIWLAILIPLVSMPVFAGEEGPSACVEEIERVCVQLEDKLETCLAQRGDQLSAPCRDQLKKAMALMEDPSGPAACIPDVQRLCPDLSAKALTSCVTGQQANFSTACQRYLQNAHPGAPSE
jgi:hypothetical protein